MSPSHRIACAAFVLLGCACARPTEVELRLHACPLDGEVPVRVDLEIRGVDGEGAALPVLAASFAIDPAALADSYVTVGLRKPEGMVEADFVLTWHDADGGSETVALRERPVPAVGEVLELGSEDCMPVDPGSTGDGTSTGSSTTDPTGTTSTSGDSETSGTSSTSGASSTTDATTSTTGATTTTGDSSSSDTGDTDDTTTGEESMVGQDCGDGQFYCEHGGPGRLGTMLHCIDGKWALGDLAVICESLFADNCPPSLGLVEPVLAGCNGYGPDGLTCVCQDASPQPCNPDEKVPCGEMGEITLCVEEQRALAVCSVTCADEAEGSVCIED